MELHDRYTEQHTTYVVCSSPVVVVKRTKFLPELTPRYFAAKPLSEWSALRFVAFLEWLEWHVSGLASKMDGKMRDREKAG